MGRIEWRPSAVRATLSARAATLADIRTFFPGRGVLEVDVPGLSSAAAVEPQLHSIECGSAASPRYLHTSPEFALKRLLAAGTGPVFYLGHVFRSGERGRWHNPEFTMLEWYRPGWDLESVTEELADLLARLGVAGPPIWLDFAEAFGAATGLDADTADAASLAEQAQRLGLSIAGAPAAASDARLFWLDALMGLVVVPGLGHARPCIVHDFPSDMAGLTRIRGVAPATAARFELYWRGVELANGGEELTDPAELWARFDNDLRARRRLGLPRPPSDARLLAALESGLPACAGVALGFDRLLALRLGFEAIAPVLPLASEIA